ncbi:hypothetical protein K458DRAFT_396150 [Lentithecium fluviatile CBS 122367]|uniref:BTB domain-containing protein n=1 Tax=Lentithecium fluviatile CBS 122367 TaxID=1168545 RepID=A0A6G1IGA1_9PLEO|nr:hypothetical protein K458DRAFT_396150 [Lentithecium fluviatile CBS 122367]
MTLLQLWRFAKRTLSSTSGIVTVEVGPDSKIYEVQKSVLMQESEYFCAALTGSWRVVMGSLVQLHDVKPRAFGVFRYVSCIDAYMLEDRLLAAEFCSAVDNAIVDQLSYTGSHGSLHAFAFYSIVIHAFKRADHILL